MAININKLGKDTVNPPVVRVTGKKVTNGVIGAKAEDSFDDQHITQKGLSVTKRDEVIYNGDITITLVPDNEFVAEDYGPPNTFTPYNEVAKHTNIVVGKRPADGNVGNFTYSLGTALNAKSNTYYTLNGKDPSRTKSNLYTGPFLVRRNTSGGDNIVLKTRTYVQGHESKVRRVDLRIIGKRLTDI